MNAKSNWTFLTVACFCCACSLFAQEPAQPSRALDPLAGRLDSRLLPALRAYRQGLSSPQAITDGLREAYAKSLPVSPEGRLPLSLDVEQIDDQKLTQISEIGAQVIHSNTQWNAVTALAALDQLEALLKVPGVKSIRLTRKPIARSGATTNDGDAAMRTNLVRQQFGYTGAGQKIGVLSDYINKTSIGPGVLSTDPSSPSGRQYYLLTGLTNQTSGDLPASIQVIDQGPALGPNDVAFDEGAAMMEVIYDIAPGANFAFASVYSDQAAMATNIKLLQDAKCNLIVDDFTYSDEPFFQDGPIAQQIKLGADAGVIHVSASGNDADRGVLTTHNPMVPNATFPDPDPNNPTGNFFHNWGIGGATPQFLPITVPAFSDIQIVVQWNQPYSRFGLGNGSTVDLNAYLYSGPSLSSSLLNNGGGVDPQGYNPVTNTIQPYGDPLETIDYTNSDPNNPVTVYLAVDRAFGSGTGLMMRVLVVSSADIKFPSGGLGGMTTFGHVAHPSVISVGAINVSNITSSTGTINADVEAGTSKGGVGASGVPYYFDIKGTALAGGPELRDCPDVAGPDGVATTFFRDSNNQLKFFGASASAANVCGMAALIRERAASVTASQMKALMRATARDIISTTPPAAAGNDNLTGAGFVDALAAINAFPSVVTSPTDKVVIRGNSTSFSVAGSGLAPLTYQWQILTNGAYVNISGETATTLTLTNVPASANGNQYRCLVGNSFGSAASKSASLTVTLPPDIVSQPKDIVVNVGSTGSFTVEAVNGTLQYQWRRNNVDIPGANSKTYVTPPVAISDEGALFSCLITNPFGTALTVSAKLSVNLNPLILSGPTATPVVARTGQTINFSATATGSRGQAVTYAWDFGDATTGTGNAVSHAYAAAANYTVTLTVTDTNNLATTAKLTVFVFVFTTPPVDPNNPDPNPVDPVPLLDPTADNSSFVDAYKTFLGLSGDTLSISKMSIGLNFAKTASDSMTISGSLKLPAGFKPDGKAILLIVGGAGRTFTLDAKAKASAQPDGVFKMTYKSKTTTESFGKFTVTFKNSTLQKFFVDEGLTDTTQKNASHTVRASVFFNGAFFDKQQSQIYNSKEGKSGKTK